MVEEPIEIINGVTDCIEVDHSRKRVLAESRLSDSSGSGGSIFPSKGLQAVRITKAL